MTRLKTPILIGALFALTLLTGCATSPASQPTLSDQVAALRQQVAQLSAQVQRQQQSYDSTITVPPPTDQPPAPGSSRGSTRHASAPASTMTPGGGPAGPYVNVTPKTMDLPAPDAATLASAKTYAVLLPFTDVGTMQRVDAFLDAHGITDRKEVTEEGHLAIYFGVYGDKRGAENRRQQISDETGLQPQIAVIGG